MSVTRDVARTKALFEDAGLVVGQTVGDYGGGLISPDDAVRARAIDAVKRMCDLTARLEAPNTYLRPGSLNPAGAWTPDPANRSNAVFDRLVASTHEICQTAEAVGAKVAVEAGVVSPLYSPTRTRDFIVAVEFAGARLQPGPGQPRGQPRRRLRFRPAS